jgi:hypothetical protein
MDEFAKSLEVMQRIKAEIAGQSPAKAAAAAAVEAAGREADRCRVVAVIDPSPAAAKTSAAAASALDQALEARDRLDARTGDLEAAALVVLKELSRLAKEQADAAKAVAFKAATERLKVAGPAIAAAFRDAGLLWMAAGDGPLDPDKLPEAFLRRGGVDLAEVRRSLMAEWDKIISGANSLQQSLHEVSNGD